MLITAAPRKRERFGSKAAPCQSDIELANTPRNKPSLQKVWSRRTKGNVRPNASTAGHMNPSTLEDNQHGERLIASFALLLLHLAVCDVRTVSALQQICDGPHISVAT